MTQPHPAHLKYRPDIDGLRALAVMSVIGFHAFPSRLSGGFIGVDIFFVISGYLISTIIYKNLDRGTFSFIDFYSRRIRRIFPALILVLLSCFVFGWFVLLADEYQQLGKHIIGGTAFLSNFVLWNEAGYFDNLSETKPLLHLWSLGIEEQFYIIWPLILWLSWKRRLNLLTVAVAIGLLSFFLNLRVANIDRIADFYSPQTRFWELMSGSALAWLMLYKNAFKTHLASKLNTWINLILYRDKQDANRITLSNTISWLGLLLISYGLWRINKDLPFPGKWALIPIFGTVFLIAAGPTAWVNRVLLSNKILVWVGLISYPLYLWHWPLFSFARIAEGEAPSISMRLLLIALAILLSYLTYQFVEGYFRSQTRLKLKLSTLIFLMLGLGILGYGTYKSEGFRWRSVSSKYDAYLKSAAIPKSISGCYDIPYMHQTDLKWFCTLGKEGSPLKFFALGDSHATHFQPLLERYANNNNVSIRIASSSGCPPVLDFQPNRGQEWEEKISCIKLNKRIFDEVKKEKISSIILISRWNYYSNGVLLESLTKTVDAYKKIGVKVFIIEDNPLQKTAPGDALRFNARKNLSLESLEGNINNFAVSQDEHLELNKVYNDSFTSLADNQNVFFIKTNDIFCKSSICNLMENSKFIYTDTNHLSEYGANLLYNLVSLRLNRN